MLYAFIHYLLNKEAISEDAFKRRIRIVRNLVDNSSNEMSDSATRVGGNRIPAILRVVDSIIEFGEVPESGTVSFNAYQLEEEARKIKWLAENPSHSSSLFALEDHRLLYGRIGIVGLDRVAPRVLPFGICRVGIPFFDFPQCGGGVDVYGNLLCFAGALSRTVINHDCRLERIGSALFVACVF